MRTLDQLYWDSCRYNDDVSGGCGCRTLEEALQRHPELSRLRDSTKTCKTCVFELAIFPDICEDCHAFSSHKAKESDSA